MSFSYAIIVTSFIVLKNMVESAKKHVHSRYLNAVRFGGVDGWIGQECKSESVR